MESSSTARAKHSWDALTTWCVTGPPSVRLREPGRRRRVALWPLSQFLWLVGVRSEMHPHEPAGDLDRWWLSSAWYRTGSAYVDNRPRGRRYYDDNAWMALVAAQQFQLTGQRRWRDRAALLGRFLLTGTSDDGAVTWVEGGDTRNACSTGAAGLVFAFLSQTSPEGVADNWREPAQKAAGFLHDRLLRSDGLIADHVRADGTVEPSVWSYNQGLAVALFDRTERPQWADDVIAAVARGLPPHTLHRQPAAFNAIWYRTLLAREPCSVPPGLAEYLDGAWHNGRDRRGLFTQVDRYDDGVVIDHSALTGLYELVSAPERVRAAVL